MAEYPHCSTTTIHAPGECHYCDGYPKLQRARAKSGESFTPNIANGWAGNVAQSKRGVANVSMAEFSEVRDPGFYGLRPLPEESMRYVQADAEFTERFYKDVHFTRTRRQRILDKIESWYWRMRDRWNY